MASSDAASWAAGLVLLALAGFAGGCSERPEEPPDGVATASLPLERGPADAAQAGAPAEGPEPALFLKAFDPGIRVSRFAQLELAAGRLRQRGAVQLLGSYLASDGAELVARSGSELVVATAMPSARGAPLRRLVRPYALGAKDVPLGDFPLASLALVGRRAFVGGQGLLGMVDFAAPEPKLEILLRSPHPAADGARTLLAAQGDRLLAIQGAAAPFFADEFRLRGSAPPQRQARIPLPPLPGRYSSAALAGSELLLMAELAGKESRGRSLRRIALGSGADAVLRTAPPGDFEEAGEWDSPAADRDPKPPSGRSAWRGLAAVGAMLVICAGERGAMVLPRAFSERTRPLFVDVDGLCLDLVGWKGRAYAMVKSGQGLRIAALADSPEGLGVAASYPVTGLWSGLVP